MPLTPARPQPRQGGFAEVPQAAFGPRSTAEIDAFLAALRSVESTNNYNAIGPTHPQLGRALGAYQIMEANWAAWARQAGIPGADWRDPRAQDRVARTKVTEYYDKYGDFGLVAAAWFGGPGAAQAMKAGVDLSGTRDSLGTNVPSYVARVLEGMGRNLPAATPASFTTNMNAAPFIDVSGGNHLNVPAIDVPDVTNAVFPVPGGTFSNDWGAPRSGGRHHEGADIFADEGTPVLSVVGGTVVKATYSDDGLGGKRAWVRGDDGNYYYYAHMADVTVGVGQRVSAGSLIGRVGRTGNAKNTPPHLHFGVAKGVGRGWFNPHPFLNSIGKTQTQGDVGPGLSLADLLATPEPDPLDSDQLLIGVFDQVANFIAGGQREPLDDEFDLFDEDELIAPEPTEV